MSSNIAIKKTIKLIVNLNLSAYDIVTELMQIKMKPGQEMKLCLIYLDCCFENSVEYNKFFGDIIQVNIKLKYIIYFIKYYANIYYTISITIHITYIRRSPLKCHNHIFSYVYSIFQCFCIMNDLIVESLEFIFRQSFLIIHLYNPNKLINFAKFFAQLLYSDSISWTVFSTVQLTESETTYSSIIYLKIIFNELITHMGRDNVKERILCP